MADYNSALPIRSENDNENANERLVTQINGGVTPANKAEVNTDNELLVHDQDLTDGSQLSQIVDPAGDPMEVNDDGSINVNVVDSAVGDQTHVFASAASIAPNTPTTVIDYTVAVSKIFLLKAIGASASGKISVVVKTGTAGVTTQTILFNSSATPNCKEQYPAPIEVIAGDKVQIIITNRDNSSSDLNAWINGVVLDA